jgi:hypothetical protein
MTSILFGAVLLCLPAADDAAKPKLSMATAVEERYKSADKKDTFTYVSHLRATFRMDGCKNVRSYGNLKVSEAKADTGEDLVLRSKDPRVVTGISDVRGFTAVQDYQIKSGRIDVRVELNAAPRAAKTFTLKGTVELLVGGEPTNVDFADVLSKEDNEALKDDAFTAAGLKVTVLKEKGGSTGRSVRYAVEGNNSIVKEINVVDADGKVLPVGHTWYPTGTGGTSHVRTSSQQLPKDAKLRVTIYKGAKTVKVPFAFDGVELP